MIVAASAGAADVIDLGLRAWPRRAVVQRIRQRS
jgi:hypothetical protein